MDYQYKTILKRAEPSSQLKLLGVHESLFTNSTIQIEGSGIYINSINMLNNKDHNITIAGQFEGWNNTFTCNLMITSVECENKQYCGQICFNLKSNHLYATFNKNQIIYYYQQTPKEPSDVEIYQLKSKVDTIAASITIKNHVTYKNCIRTIHLEEINLHLEIPQPEPFTIKTLNYDYKKFRMVCSECSKTKSEDLDKLKKDLSLTDNQVEQCQVQIKLLRQIIDKDRDENWISDTSVFINQLFTQPLIYPQFNYIFSSILCPIPTNYFPLVQQELSQILCKSNCSPIQDFCTNMCYVLYSNLEPDID